MAQGISIHVVDVSRGVVATGMQVELIACDPRRPIAAGTIGITGLLESPALAQPMQSSHYEAVFHVAAYFRAAGVPLPGTPFLDIITYRFGIDRPDQHYHLPMKLTPWGYSCFRGGA